MTLTQTIDIPDSRRVVFDIPREMPTGKANIIIFPVREAATLKNNEEPLKGREFGCAKGKYNVTDAFFEPLEDFKDYM